MIAAEVKRLGLHARGRQRHVLPGAAVPHQEVHRSLAPHGRGQPARVGARLGRRSRRARAARDRHRAGDLRRHRGRHDAADLRRAGGRASSSCCCRRRRAPAAGAADAAVAVAVAVDSAAPPPSRFADAVAVATINLDALSAAARAAINIPTVASQTTSPAAGGRGGRGGATPAPPPDSLTLLKAAARAAACRRRPFASRARPRRSCSVVRVDGLTLGATGGKVTASLDFVELPSEWARNVVAIIPGQRSGAQERVRRDRRAQRSRRHAAARRSITIRSRRSTTSATRCCSPTT